MKDKLIKTLSKKQLREVVSKTMTVDETKLSKMSREKCIEKMENLSYNQIIKLSKED